ncbi:MAG: IS3 family transposase [Eubacterium sp.]
MVSYDQCQRKAVHLIILPVRGVFGRIKNEMFYNADWSGVNISEFIGILNDYLYWYNEKRIKKSLGYLSPIEYRHRLGLVT